MRSTNIFLFTQLFSGGKYDIGKQNTWGDVNQFKFEYGTGYKLAGQTFCDKSEDFLLNHGKFNGIVGFKYDSYLKNSMRK